MAGDFFLKPGFILAVSILFFVKLDVTDNPLDAPTLYSIRNNGVNFINSHALFPPFTTPNASAIANSQTDAQVVVAANRGSDPIYLPSKDPNLAKRVVGFLADQDYIDGIFVDDDLGLIPGTLPLSAINLKGSAQTPTPSIVVNFKHLTRDVITQRLAR